jgi:hypothetical protein
MYLVNPVYILQVWESLKTKEPKEMLTMSPNERGVDLSNTEATGEMTRLQ